MNRIERKRDKTTGGTYRICRIDTYSAVRESGLRYSPSTSHGGFDGMYPEGMNCSQLAIIPEGNPKAPRFSDTAGALTARLFFVKPTGEIRMSWGASQVSEYGQNSVAAGAWEAEYVAIGSSMKVLIWIVRSPDDDSVDEGE